MKFEDMNPAEFENHLKTEYRYFEARNYKTYEYYGRVFCLFGYFAYIEPLAQKARIVEFCDTSGGGATLYVDTECKKGYTVA